MTAAVLQYKWMFLILGEVFFTLFIACFLLVKYWFGWERLSFLFIILLLISDGWLLLLGILDYTQTKSFSLFQAAALLFVLYAVTIGKHDMRKLDMQIKQKTAKWKGLSLDEEEQKKKTESNG
jgi:hypothetical protein